MAAPEAMGDDTVKKKEIYSYHAPWLIYGMNWSVRADKRFRLAIGSFEEEYTNTVRIVQLDPDKQCFVETGEFDHPYPTTKIMWLPDQQCQQSDLLATTGDYLRLWHVSENGSPRLECLLNNVRGVSRCTASSPTARAQARRARSCVAPKRSGPPAAYAPRPHACVRRTRTRSSARPSRPSTGMRAIRA